MSPALTAGMLLVAALVFAFTMTRRIAPLLALRREDRLDRAGERLRALLRFGLGQRRLVDPEERGPGLLHVLIFVAFLVLALRTITLFGMGFSAGFHLPLLAPESALGRAYLFAKDLVVLGALVGVAGFLWRRLVTRPDRLTRSPEGVVILLFIAGLMVTDMAWDASGIVFHDTLRAQIATGRADFVRPVLEWSAPAGSLAAYAFYAAGFSPGAVFAIGAAAFWLHLALILVFGNVLPYGKHFHIITALPNVFFTRLPPTGALQKLELEAEDARFGTATVKDLSWKEAWDVYSCTECGRCQTHCPTYVTGKPLSHKEVNRAIRHHLAEVATPLTALARAKDPAARDAALAALPPIASVVPPETFWACTTCGWCETGCPVLIENIPRLVDMRRQAVQVDATFPDEAQRVFRGIETQGNPWGIGSNKRAEWCEDLDVPRAASGEPFEWLFFVGCAGAFDDRQRKVSRAIVSILREAKVSFAILGEEETCTGDAARRLGNEYLFQMQATALVETLNGHGVKKILVQCPHCLNTLANELPQFGGRYEVVHHAELIARLVREGRLRPTAAAGLGEVTFHDPCYLARWNGITEAPREALAAAGVSVREMPRNRRQGFCCGAGGGRFWLEEKLGSRVNQARVAEAAATLGDAGGVVATGCPFCLTMMKDAVNETGREEKLRVLDVAEIVARGLSDHSARAGADQASAVPAVPAAPRREP
ncbi:(Fe-S)-binding protein [Anaeromyxobacter oryzisoli]|uniref:(Fe-S)-binding protein n=1 Tax=Anaeromyxobacter oryzisoli TaxID=2925408 RepID=UPI001F573E69|nr:(Fe-S)-binding protein [Anaeromyxobacter sp. SG63]